MIPRSLLRHALRLNSGGARFLFIRQMLCERLSTKLSLLKRFGQGDLLLLCNSYSSKEIGNGFLSSFDAFLFVLALSKILLLFLFCRLFPFLLAS